MSPRTVLTSLLLLALAACSSAPADTTHTGAVSTKIPPRVEGWFAGVLTHPDSRGGVGDFTAADGTGAVAGCRTTGSTPAWEAAAAGRRDVAWDVRRDHDEVVFRQLGVYADTAQAASVVADILEVVPSGAAASDCVAFGDVAVTRSAAGSVEEFADEERLAGFDDGAGLFEQWQLADRTARAAYTIVVREDNAVFVHRTVDDAHTWREQREADEWELPVERAGRDAQLLCVFDAADPCPVAEAPLLPGATGEVL